MGRKERRKKGGIGKFKRNLRQEIFEVFNQYPDKHLNYKQVSGALGVTDSSFRMLVHEILKEEVEKENLISRERGKFKLQKVVDETATGTIQINRHGRGFVIIEGRDDDLEIPRNETGTALWGDTVEVSFNPRSKRPNGKITQIVERGAEQYVGIIEMSKNYAFCIPSNQKIHVDFFIPTGKLNGAKNGEKVIIELRDWENPKDSPLAEVVEVLGKPGDNDVEMHSIMVEYGLPYDFPDEVEHEAQKIPEEITKAEIAKRRDFRDICTFTIDPEDAKDFDDALSIQKLEHGKWEIGVHIADVSHYLQEDSILETEAYSRATSVYLVDRTIPMLPEVLSNKLCSLRPNEEKLCFSAVFELNEKAHVQKQWFGRTVILSDRRFTYEEAQERIESGKGDFSDEINVLDKLAKQMRERRFDTGAIDFHSEEVRFNLDEDGKPISVYVKEMKDSNRLIEDFMLLANTKVAEFIGKKEKEKAKTFVYRVHDEPDPGKIHDLREFVMKFGYKLPKPNSDNSATIIRDLLKKVHGKTEDPIIQQMAIRSMQKAVYTTKNVGHFGLGFDFYTHFTSPIRRYPDVMVHRLLQQYLDEGKSADEKAVERKCKYSSELEKRAQQAEWASIKYKQVEFMLARIGEQFTGVISGLSNWGMYVELPETKCEGMVRLDTLRDDYYSFDDAKYLVKGKRRGEEFHMGDEVEIKIIGADLVKRQLDFEIL